MPIVTQCPHCGKRLKAPDERVGQQAKCPQCKAGFVIAAVADSAPAASNQVAVASAPVAAPQVQPSATSPTPKPQSSRQPAVATAPTRAAAVDQGMWHVQTADGSHYGPVTKADLDAWVADERLDVECQVLMDGWDQWKWAEEVYPQLAAGSAQSDPFDVATTVPSHAPVDDNRNPYASPTSAGRTRSAVTAIEVNPADDGWIYARIGVLISQFSLMAAAAAVLIIGIGVLNMAGAASSGTGGPPASFGSSMLFMSLGGLVYFASFFTLLTGWVVCLGAPRSARAHGLLYGALGGAAAGLLFLVVMATMITTRSFGGPSEAKFMYWLSQVCLAAGYALFAYYLAGLAQVYNDAQMPKIALGYAIFQGVSAVCITLSAFAFDIQTISPDIQITLFIIAGIVSNGVLVFMALKTNGHIARILKSRALKQQGAVV